MIRISVQKIKALSRTTFERRFKKSGAGFTLIEIIVVISVIGILTVAGIAAFVSFSRSQTLNTAASGVADMLNTAKSRAYSQVKPPGCTDTDTLKNYEVRICGMNPSCVISGSTNVNYELDVNCGIKTPNISYLKLPNGYSFNTSASTPHFIFPVIKGGVAASGSITISGYGAPKTITVDASGNVTVN